MGIKATIVLYAGFAILVFLWQVFAFDFFQVCEFNAGACGVKIKDYALNALIWPYYLLI